jgi:hypothetical protein
MGWTADCADAADFCGSFADYEICTIAIGCHQLQQEGWGTYDWEFVTYKRRL